MRVCEVGVNEKSGAKVAVQAVFPSSEARDVTSRGWDTRFSVQKGCSPKLSTPFCFGGADTPPQLYIFEGRSTVTDLDRLFISRKTTEMRFI